MIETQTKTEPAGGKAICIKALQSHEILSPCFSAFGQNNTSIPVRKRDVKKKNGTILYIYMTKRKAELSPDVFDSHVLVRRD